MVIGVFVLTLRPGFTLCRMTISLSYSMLYSAGAMATTPLSIWFCLAQVETALTG